MSRSVLDVEAWSTMNRAKLDLMVGFFGASPAAAGRALMVMDLSPEETRAIVTEAVVVAAQDPAVREALSALWPLVDRWRRRPDVEALLGDDATDLGLLWGCLVALGWSVDAPA